MDKEELRGPLRLLPKVEFACAYGSGVFPQPNHSSHSHQEPMVDYIFGVSDPIQWHSENLEKNSDHYSFPMRHCGSKTITKVAEGIGAGVHFNPFVPWKDKIIKYGVVRMDELIKDVLNWHWLYVSGRLQKPVKKIVQGNADRFQILYKDQIHRSAESGLLRLPLSSGNSQALLAQDSSIQATTNLVSFLPPSIRSRMGADLGQRIKINTAGKEVSEVMVKGREEVVRSMQKAIKSTVRSSSLRQAVSGFLAVGGANATSYLAKKISKAWRS